ncbi:MAG: HIT family protein [Candidatus Manganitrophus sp.]|nr:HIT family protein [Candidatus Manganitrophus sp.]
MSKADRSSCGFCKIIRGEVPSHPPVFEDAVSFAFLDHRPLFEGHLLLSPKMHYETLTDLPAGLIAPLFGSAQLLARAVEEGMTAEGTFIAINNRVSQSVPHLPHPYRSPPERGRSERILLAAPRLQEQ